MNQSVKEMINKRRAYRALEKVDISKELIEDLAVSAQLSASCFNYQPWRFVFVYEQQKLEELFTVLSESNDWAKKASMIIVVFSMKSLDCAPDTREYFLFDTGMATTHMILRGTELGLVIHPIAGYNPQKVKEQLKIPDEMTVITLLIVGKKTNNLENLTEKQKIVEETRPKRKELIDFVFINEYSR